jgi:hypothetical protein
MGRGESRIGRDEKGTRKGKGRKTTDDEIQNATRKTEENIRA